jgi:peptidyl-prolyl cis-trans isomerase B (cyclophilin B)
VSNEGLTERSDNARGWKSLKAVLAVCLGLAVLLVACGWQKTKSKDADTGDDGEEVFEPAVKKNVKPEADAEVAVIEMENPAYGRIVMELYPNLAPKMVERFKQLVREKFYDGTTFHRIDPQLGIIQGGDPLSKDNNPANDGTGNSQYPNLPAEFSDVLFERGTIGAARQGEGPELSEEQAKDTANCQFFITIKHQPAFDREYTVFGRVIEGINNVDVISGAPVAEGTDSPADKIIIKSITLQPRKQ